MNNKKSLMFAALLHDIGKFYQRTGKKHDAYYNNLDNYNYGSNGKYTKDNLIIANNIINNKSNNTSNLCLFLNKNNESLNNCANNKMLSLIPSKNTTYQDIKNNLHNGDLLLITNTQELSSIIDYIQSKGYKIVPLNDIITE